MSEDVLEKFEKRLEMFQKGFEMITQNLNTQLTKIATEVAQLNERASFMPKTVKDNKEIYKEAEKANLLISTLMARLDAISDEKY
jgi:predicted component of viral defense system (DUF524 family)